jgi:hypothetical protein
MTWCNLAVRTSEGWYVGRDQILCSAKRLDFESLELEAHERDIVMRVALDEGGPPRRLSVVCGLDASNRPGCGKVH